ncbi:unannotated protein [freshwater metagenome]|uniref:Unannotated protein n=1 Tax=freshwater metagenome TaxID=449393 RepID=A0A6J7LWY8_9ZZZZ
MSFFEVFAFLHGKERRARGVAHNRHSVPLWRAEWLVFDIAQVCNFGTHGRKWSDWRVRVIGGFAGNCFSSVVVVGDFDILHEVERPEAAVIFWLHVEPSPNQFDVDGSVGVLELFCHCWSYLGET